MGNLSGVVYPSPIPPGIVTSVPSEDNGELSINNIVRISQANYDSLTEKDENTLYVIVG
jgi:hypothetical protein